MGVKGLSSFFRINSRFIDEYELHDCKVVIDGNNLKYFLYFQDGRDNPYGGDYNTYAEKIKEYFSSFEACGVKPYVVFDGAYDTEKEFKESLEKQRGKIAEVCEVVQSSRTSKVHFLPICTQLVFQEVLTEMKIPFAQCPYDADSQIAAIANILDCPVISEDNDFYIFDINNGFIKTSTLNNEANVSKAMNCKIYNINNFVSKSKGIDKKSLHLMASLLSSVPDIVLYKILGLTGSRLPDHGLISELLYFLSGKSEDDVIKQMQQNVSKTEIRSLHEAINRNSMYYNKSDCYIRFLATKNPNDSMEFKPTAPCGGLLPSSFTEALLLGKIPHFFLNIIGNKRTVFPRTIEHFHSESIYACSIFLRQVLYGILLQHSEGDSPSHAERCLGAVDEYDRGNFQNNKKQIIKKEVHPLFTLQGKELPNLFEVHKLDKKEKLELILHILGVNSEFISDIPQHLQLFLGCVLYFLQNSNKKPPVHFMQAVLIGVIYFGHATKVVRGTTLHMEGKSDKVDFHSMACKTSVAEAESFNQRVCSVVKKNLVTLNIVVVHAYAQLQTCLLYGMYLNMLLEFPLTNPKLHDLIEGSFLHNLTNALQQSNGNVAFFFDKKCDSLSKMRYFLEEKLKHLEGDAFGR